MFSLYLSFFFPVTAWLDLTHKQEVLLKNTTNGQKVRGKFYLFLFFANQQFNNFISRHWANNVNKKLIFSKALKTDWKFFFILKNCKNFFLSAT